MAQKLDDSELVSYKELLLANSIQTDALAQLLIEKDIINKNSHKRFDAWDKQDEVDAWECQRTKRIENIQGNENPFVKQACAREGLW